jgi:cytochrome c1
MDEESRKKNRRLLIAIIVFVLAFTVLIILWKLSIYQKT